ncbi:MAG TPA: sucrase ferredoxin [Nostocaceae cyanobacterium]|nr:sucrase ferredoxin [Nostocaceae cyanobacterium]
MSMNNFFCAQNSRQLGEDPIGNGENIPIYVLIECPTPWTRQAYESKAIPENLRDLKKAWELKNEPIEFLLMYDQENYQSQTIRVLIFRQVTGFSQGYHKYEFSVAQINEVAPLVNKYLLDKSLDIYNSQSSTRDIFICTHGSNDKCCAKYGNPFYRQVKNIVKNLSLSHVRVWQASHFGGHRFAPTAIDFPEGRFYGRLDEIAMTSILTRTGNLDIFNYVYRGWAILPPVVQVLEREMIFIYGWDWFNYQVAYRVIEESNNQEFHRVELSFIQPNGGIGSVEADIVLDQSKEISLIGSCNGTVAEVIPQFRVENLSTYVKRN